MHKYCLVMEANILQLLMMMMLQMMKLIELIMQFLLILKDSLLEMV